MMKLKIEEVLEYLQAGEKDQQMEQRLRADPDGPGLLRQAKLMYELLGRLSDSPDSDDLFAGEPADALAVVAEAATSYDYRDRDLFDEKGDEQVLRTAMKDAPAMSRLAARSAGPYCGIGTLVIRLENDLVELSWDDRTSARRRAPGIGKLPPKLGKSFEKETVFYQSAGPRTSRFATDGGVTVRGVGLKMGFPESMSASLPLWTHVIDTRLRIPARGLDLTFIPETGRVVKVATGTDGRAQMPMPEGSGVLRIETTPPQFLRIELQ